MRDNLHPWAPLHDKLRHYIRLELSDIFLSEQELPIEIRQINCVHIDQVDVPDTRHGKVLDNLTSQTTGSNY